MYTKMVQPMEKKGDKNEATDEEKKEVLVIRTKAPQPVKQNRLKIFYPKSDYCVKDDAVYHTKSNSLVVDILPYKATETEEHHIMLLDCADVNDMAAIGWRKSITPTIFFKIENVEDK